MRSLAFRNGWMACATVAIVLLHTHSVNAWPPGGSLKDPGEKPERQRRIDAGPPPIVNVLSAAGTRSHITNVVRDVDTNENLAKVAEYAQLLNGERTGEKGARLAALSGELAQLGIQVPARFVDTFPTNAGRNEQSGIDAIARGDFDDVGRTEKEAALHYLRRIETMHTAAQRSERSRPAAADQYAHPPADPEGDRARQAEAEAAEREQFRRTQEQRLLQEQRVAREAQRQQEEQALTAFATQLPTAVRELANREGLYAQMDRMEREQRTRDREAAAARDRDNNRERDRDENRDRDRDSNRDRRNSPR